METFDPDGVEQPVFVIGERYETLDEPLGAYRRARLIHASVGVLIVRTETERWVVPPGHAVWMPAGVLHRLSAAGPVEFHSLYVAHGRRAAPAAQQCRRARPTGGSVADRRGRSAARPTASTNPPRVSCKCCWTACRLCALRRWA